MLRRFILVGVFVVVKPGSIEQLAFAACITLLYLAFQLTASPFKQMADDFLAATCSLALSVLFLLCLLYKYGGLTQLDDVQAVMSAELQADYLVSYVSLSGILWATCMSTFAALGAIILRKIADKALERARVRRLICLKTKEEARIGKEYMQDKAELEKMINGPDLYRKDEENYIVKQPRPTTGPFHIFLSHSVPLRFQPCVIYDVIYDADLQYSHLIGASLPHRLEARPAEDENHQESSA